MTPTKPGDEKDRNEQENGEQDSMESHSQDEDVGEYLKRVKSELAIRKARLLTFDEKLGEIKFQLNQIQPTRNLIRGDARSVAQIESFRRSLLAKQQKLEHDRNEAQLDLNRAEERLKLVESEE